MCWVSWDRLSKPKAAGGLGFKDIQLFNQALLAKQAWRILTNPGSLLARILLGKYCHKRSFLDIQAPTVCSHGWRSIIHRRDLLNGDLGKAIGNGQTTRVWHDSWISLSEHIKVFGPINENALDLTVVDLLTDDLSWNSKRIEEFLPQFAKQIQSIQPSQKGVENVYIGCQPVQSGIYSTKSGYNTAAANLGSNQYSSPQEFNWIKDIWSGKCSPKMKVFLWSIIQQALPLGDNLQSRGVQAEGLFSRCKERETTMHTFVECPFTKEVWKLIPLQKVVHQATCANFKEVLIKFRKVVCLPPSGIPGSILPWICWAIWTSRNLLSRNLTAEETATKGIKLAREWNSTRGALTDRTKPSSARNLAQGALTDSTTEPTATCKSDAA